MKTFRTSLDKLNRMLSPIVVIIPLGMLFLYYQFAPTERVLMIAGLFLFIVLVVAYGYRPLGYRIGELVLYIDRPMGSIEIKITDITQVKPLKPIKPWNMIRTFGVAGFLGYYGHFWNKELGSFQMYAGNLKNLIHIKTTQGVYVISPDSLELWHILSEKIKKIEHYG